VSVRSKYSEIWARFAQQELERLGFNPVVFSGRTRTDLWVRAGCYVQLIGNYTLRIYVVGDPCPHP